MMLLFALLFVKCGVQEISLLTHWEYGIAQVTKVYRGGKGEMHINYWYDVAGVRYERVNIWDGKVQPGERYVVRYGTFDPDGNDFRYDLAVPASITEPHGRPWQVFLRYAHFHPPYIPYSSIMEYPIFYPSVRHQPEPSFQ